jgi:WS/DGAT/MGAT family acyltransferase
VPTLKQLSGLDSLFLYAENSRTPLEVSSLHIYDPSTSPRGSVRFKEVIATIDQRLEQAGVFHRKVLEVPFSYDHPYWVEDEHFDIEYHVRHIALPKPGDWRQLMIQVSRLRSRRLDQTRPLWEAYIIEGLDNVEGLPPGCFALFLKMHHATVDGVAGAALQAAIHDLKPLEPAAADSHSTVRDLPRAPPGVAELLARGTLNNIVKSTRLFVGLGQAIPRLIMAKLATPDDGVEEVPATLFNRGRVTANRVIDGCQFDLAELKAIADSCDDATINDVALAIVGGALRMYLSGRDDLPDRSLIAACPVNLRSEDSADADNMVSMMNTPLHTEIEEPRERLEAIVAGTHRAKAFTDIVGAGTLTAIPMNVPAFVARGLMEPLINLAMRLDTLSFNTIVSNIPGIQQPLYFCGAKMVAVYGMGPVIDRAGLFHAVFSYDGKITFTFTACREMLPDPATYADCVRTSFDELRLLPARQAPTRVPRRSSSR